MKEHNRNHNVTIGIDLGTRNALCACMDGARPVMIPNRWGRTSTPSVVGWDGGWVVGEDAVRLSLRGSCSVWWDLKRKVGGEFRALCGGKSHTAQDILAPLLCALREDAEVFLGQFVSSCVLAVPAAFSLLQREAIARAAEAAGLREVRIISEPTAAALAFGREGRFLVVDFGAGTVDVAVVESEGGVWQVLESVGTSKIGGYDFDLALAEWLRERLRLDPLPSQDPRWRTLVWEAESIKIALSSCRSYDWLPPAMDGVGVFEPLKVEREDLERMVRFSIRRVVHLVRKLWTRHEPEHLLLVGGSSRIPLLREILEKEVARPERLSLCAEESIVAGAALCARTGSGRLLLDVLSGDIGFLRDDRPEVLVSAGTPVPFTTRSVFVPAHSGKMELPVFQNVGDTQEERTILSFLTLDVEAGKEVEIRCTLSTSGLMHCVVRQGNTTVEMPLLSLKRGALLATPSSSSFSFSSFSSSVMAARRRIRDLKLRLTPLEILCSSGQLERLHGLVRRIENIEDDGPSVEILEGIVKDLEVALS
ncbi:MAG: Hsp70 family protein [Synergistaceae bacterium]|jgi:molecular chaperone DnaK (HSP70)|nr:Hsp70 family protein [Synergistaceae bacterium]